MIIDPNLLNTNKLCNTDWNQWSKIKKKHLQHFKTTFNQVQNVSKLVICIYLPFCLILVNSLHDRDN